MIKLSPQIYLNIFGTSSLDDRPFINISRYINKYVLDEIEGRAYYNIMSKIIALCSEIQPQDLDN